eukprot:6247976-Amphidinium_carterae.1
MCIRDSTGVPFSAVAYFYMWVFRSGSDVASQLGTVWVRVALTAPAVGQSHDLHVRALELLKRREGFLGQVLLALDLQWLRQVTMCETTS